MFTFNQYRNPAIGKEAELRGVAEEAVKLVQGLGARASLTQHLFHPEGLTFVSVVTLPSLEALMALRAQANADSRYVALLNKTNSLIRKPPGAQLFHLIVPPAQGQEAAARYVTRAQAYPALGKDAEMRALLEDFVRTRQGEGRPQLRLLREVFNADGPIYRAVTTYTDLADLEDNRVNPPPTVREFSARISALSRSPITMDFLEVIVPFQS